MSKAALLDNNYRTALSMIKGQNSSSKKSSSSNRSFRGYNPRTPARDPNAMDIDALSFAERKEYLSKGLCFICANRGHRASECPNRKKIGNSNDRTNQRFGSKDPKAAARKINAVLGEFEEEERSKVFDEFERLNGSTKTEDTPTGF